MRLLRGAAHPGSRGQEARGAGNSEAGRFLTGSFWRARPDNLARLGLVARGLPDLRTMILRSDRTSLLEGPPTTNCPWSAVGRERSPGARSKSAKMMGSIGSKPAKSPDVTRHHRQEGADARRDRNTRSVPARLWDLCRGGRRSGQHPDPADPADRRGALLRLWGLWDLGARDPQLDGATDPGSGLGDLEGVAARRGPSRPLSPLWRTDRTAALRERQGPLHSPAGGGGGPGL